MRIACFLILVVISILEIGPVPHAFGVNLGCIIPSAMVLCVGT